MQVFVVMSNDYPARAFSTEAKAEAYIKVKKSEEDNKPDHERRIYWRSYEFTLDQE